MDALPLARPNPLLHRLACVALLGLIVLCLAWELWLAPLRPGGSWLVVKVIPLLLPLRKVLKADNYTMQWTTLLIWLYFTEGAVRASSDHGTSALLGGIEVALSLLYFTCAALYLRPLKQMAKRQKQKETGNEPDRS